MKKIGMGLALVVGLTACGRAPGPASGEPASGASIRAVLPDSDDDAVTPYARATRALAERRLMSPSGDNAIEHYLAAREDATEAARAQTALAELQPYVVIAAEQAIARGDAAEGERLLVLIERVDARAPALPRLRKDIAALQREQAAQATVAALETPPPSVMVAPRPTTAPPSPAVADEPAPASASAPAAANPAPPPAPVMAEMPPPLPAAARAAPMIRTPRLIQDAQPRYPLPALRARIEGQADVAFTIQPDGSVRDVRLLSSSPAGLFDASALAVAQRWRFEPSGQAHASQRTVRFRLPADAEGGAD
ncbi:MULTISPECIES: energy transducer TonB [unclassified Pseudoxanthomonas]|uniref:energy transducer TonB n=1 Tax=unclassified Pseudoxanthomonas TaxID=2645906 RepID=UPI0008EC0ACA|nr:MULTISPECIES: energy transducer TonB [unclassified Pseudoxanthomonas]PPJ41348.1 energy transducer TonB [Pseudoxanthomonas sp. KAs_5_3]SFV30546.1 protein TonB [Pseudoxanthomonas sp. YR558]